MGTCLEGVQEPSLAAKQSCSTSANRLLACKAYVHFVDTPQCQLAEVQLELVKLHTKMGLWDGAFKLQWEHDSQTIVQLHDFSHLVALIVVAMRLQAQLFT
jgi:hypothetical protein